MIYIFDTSSFRELQHFYPTIFQSIWPQIAALVAHGVLLSTREVLHELEIQNVNDTVLSWCKSNRQIFTTPTVEELNFVNTILAVRQFQSIIPLQKQLTGTPVADPFVIACAWAKMGTVVTEEGIKPNAATIPNLCKHFNIPCVNLEGFMSEQGWRF